MANPNFLEASIGRVSMLFGTRYYALQAGRTSVQTIGNSVGANGVGKIASLIVAGMHNTAAGHHLVSITIYNGTNYFHIVKNLPVFDGTTVNLVDRENPIYVPEGHSVLCRGFKPDGSDVDLVDADDLPNINCELEVYYVS